MKLSRLLTTDMIQERLSWIPITFAIMFAGTLKISGLAETSYWPYLYTLLPCLAFALIEIAVSTFTSPPAQDAKLPTKFEFLQKLASPKINIISVDEVCLICRDELQNHSTEELAELPCGHVYHRECLTSWWTQGRRPCVIPYCARRAFKPDYVKMIWWCRTWVTMEIASSISCIIGICFAVYLTVCLLYLPTLTHPMRVSRNLSPLLKLVHSQEELHRIETAWKLWSDVPHPMLELHDRCVDWLPTICIALYGGLQLHGSFVYLAWVKELYRSSGAQWWKTRDGFRDPRKSNLGYRYWHTILFLYAHMLVFVVPIMMYWPSSWQEVEM